MERQTLSGESFNFGPKAEQARTVAELLDDLAGNWSDHWDRPPVIADEEPAFEEAGLLKLNCDKALHHLAWEPTLAYKEAVEMTGSWYRRVLQKKSDPRGVTLEQIVAFSSLGRERGRAWAA
jgi:CDP-glucose 4,6-dehydratase